MSEIESAVEEPILKENNTRFVLFPIEHNDIWEFYKKAEASFWTAEEIDLSQDLKDWGNLNDGERHFISHAGRTVLRHHTGSSGGRGHFRGHGPP